MEFSPILVSMKSLALFVILCLCLCGQDGGANGSEISGIAIDALTRQPLESVHVTIYGAETYGALSGRDGHFSFVGIRPGKYGVRARRNGFFRVEKPRAQVVVNPGESKSDLTVEMTPEAVITGRVMDEYGDPVRVSVQAVPAPPNDPDQFILQSMHGLTDERGQFRIAGALGKFYVTATPMVQGGPREIRTDGSDTVVYGPTWYPASDSKERSVVVNAAGGRTTTDIDIRLVSKRSLTISGVVSGIPGTAIPNGGSDKPVRADLVLSTKYRNQFFTTETDGRFSLSGLAPDQYTLTARILNSATPLFSQPVEIKPETTGIEGIDLRLVAGEEVEGTLEIEGMPGNAGVEAKRSVKLEPLVPRNASTGKGGEVDADGGFHIAPLYPGTFRVSVTPLPENAYLKSVRVNGGGSGGDVVDLSRGVAGSSMKVVISRNGAQIEGTVSAGATVILAENPGDSRHITYAAAEKQYRFTGLHPGKYRLIASATQGLQPDKLEGMFEAAPEFEVHEGDRITRDVKIPMQENPRATQ
jgi:Carboxypeptidase regulatory-like domain